MFSTDGAFRGIRASGSLTYGRGIQADYRELFLNLDIEAVLGQLDPNRMVPAALRGLKTGNPESVELYLEEVNKYYRDHNLVKRIYQLWNTHKSLSKEHMARLLEGIDEDKGRAMLAAEKHLRRPRKPYKWSNKLRVAGLLRRYWKTRLNDHYNDRFTYHTYNNLCHQLTKADAEYT